MHQRPIKTNLINNATQNGATGLLC